MGHYFAFANADPVLGENRWMTIYNEPGKMAGVYRSCNHAGVKAYFAFRRREPLTYDYWDVEEQITQYNEEWPHKREPFAHRPWFVLWLEQIADA